MEVILLQDVPKLGHAGEVQTVKNGYAQNFLIPRGLVEMATPEKKKALEKRQAEIKAQQEAQEGEWKKLIEKLDGTTLAMTVPANEKGHLYQQITPTMIAKHISKEVGSEIPSFAPQLETELKTVGEHSVLLHLGKSHATITLSVKSE